MTAAGIDLALSRWEAEQEMRETCRITRPSGGKVWSEELLQYVKAPPDLVYEGRCKLRFSGARTRRSKAADQAFTEQGPTLSLPVLASLGVHKDDRVDITGSEDDPDLVGVVVFIDADRAQTNATSRRIPVRETQ
ncbi:DUF6093 family protein [Microbacterium sp. MMO-10]|uniref:DUF6093 family protein n=1 Tax=Microbacterium sp. MMO-10 TaxID=3081272 RepID=UPI003017A96F